MKKFLRISISLAVSAVLIWLSVRDVKWNEFRGAVKRISYSSVFYVILVNYGAALIRAFRWKCILSGLHSIPYRYTYNYSNIGFLANSILPARAGELIRGVLLAKKLNVSKVSILTTIVLERLFDLLPLFFFLLYSVLVADLPAWFKKGGAMLVSASIIMLILFILISRKEDMAEALQRRFPFLPERFKAFLSSKLDNFQRGLRVLRSLRSFVIILAFSAAIWLIYGLSVFFIASQFPINGRVWEASMICLLLTSLASIIPSSPGYFGPYQYACILAFGIYGLSKPESLAISFLIQIPIFLLNIVVGAISLLWEGVNLDISKLETS